MLYRHTKTGGIYSLRMITTREEDLAPVAVYQDANGMIWVRPAKDFFDGRFEVVVAAHGVSPSVPIQ